jgi:predicted alpha-1,2-mannosidase
MIDMKRRISFAILSVLAFLPLGMRGQSPVDEVNLYMGVRGNSNCVIGPQMPHGSVNPSPETLNGGQGGYKEGQPVREFTQLHVSGTGWTRYGQIMLSPQIGFNAAEDGHDSDISDEQATPYYYKAMLNRYGILSELSPSYHSVIYRFTFPDKGKKNILLDLKHNIAQHIVPEVKGKFYGGKFEFTNDPKLIIGWAQYSGGFGSKKPYRVYFAVRLDDQAELPLYNSKGEKELYAQIHLKPNTHATLVRVGVSMRSWQQALIYLQAELGNRSFEEVRANCRTAWEAMLLRINVKGGTPQERSLFYTTLYHSLVMPHDRTGDNPRWNEGKPHIDDHYCAWDTWRTCYPLLTLINTSFVSKTINSFIDRLKHDGMCTATFTSSLEHPENQGGDDVDNIIADAILKDVGGFDVQEAYNVMKHNALCARDSVYRQLGWIPGEHKMMSCSYTMEYAYNDDCLSRVARKLGYTAMADSMEQRAQGWKNMFNPNLESGGYKGFIGPRKANGDWITIDPAHDYLSWVDYFYEGNSWTYTLFTPAQMEQLINLCGGKEQMVNRLEYGFNHGFIHLTNEPGFLSPFYYAECGRPDLLAQRIRQLRTTGYSLEKGYPDNEDSGAMGSWYVFTSIGLFPNAGQDFYYLLPPQFDDVILTMENGKMIRCKVIRSTPEANTIDHVTLDGRRLDTLKIRHQDIANGADILYYLK